MNIKTATNDVHVFGPEKRKLSYKDQPLWERVLQGPSDDIMRIFLMDADEEEVSNDVSAETPYYRHTSLSEYDYKKYFFTLLKLVQFVQK